MLCWDSVISGIVGGGNILRITHQGPGTERRACPGRGAVGGVPGRCEGHSEGTAEVEDGTAPCGHKHERKKTLSCVLE